MLSNTVYTQNRFHTHTVLGGYRLFSDITIPSEAIRGPKKIHNDAFAIAYRSSWSINRRIEFALEPTFVYANTGSRTRMDILRSSNIDFFQRHNFSFGFLEFPLIFSIANRKPYERQFSLGFSFGPCINFNGIECISLETYNNTSWELVGVENLGNRRFSPLSNSGSRVMFFYSLGLGKRFNVTDRALSIEMRYRVNFSKFQFDGPSYSPVILPRLLLNIGISLNKTK